MSDAAHKFMLAAIRQAGKSIPERARDPRVGAVAVRNGEILALAHRGELKSGEHAEYTLLERKLLYKNLRGATIFTTLEPCTKRGHPKTPCASWLVMRRVGEVYIGMLDPNPDIRGLGVRTLLQYGIAVEFFPLPLRRTVENQNAVSTAVFDGASQILRISYPSELRIPGPTPASELAKWLNKPVKPGRNIGSHKYRIEGHVRDLIGADRIHVYVYTNRRHEQGDFAIKPSGDFSGHVFLDQRSTSFAVYFQVTRGQETLFRTIALVG